MIVLSWLLVNNVRLLNYVVRFSFYIILYMKGDRFIMVMAT